jgi:hypothetical protein
VLHVEVRPDLGLHLLEQQLAHEVGVLARELEDALRDEVVARAADVVDRHRRQELQQEAHHRVELRHRDHVAGRALQHRHQLGLVRHRGDEGDGGGARADHDHAFAAVVEVLRPELWVDDLALEVFAALEFGREAFFVVVVAGAHHQPVARQQHRLAGLLLHA